MPAIEIQCPNYCCSINFVSLSLSYAKTGHTFQGQSAGPEHPIQCIIIQPGSSNMEELCPGLLYMFISRGTTIGKKGNRSSSAIFFIGDELTKERIKNLTKTKSGEICRKIQRRSKWIKFQQKNKLQINISAKQRRDLIQWASKTVINVNVTKKIIEDDSWRQCKNTNY
jgi:hypothetical protein